MFSLPDVELWNIKTLRTVSVWETECLNLAWFMQIYLRICCHLHSFNISICFTLCSVNLSFCLSANGKHLPENLGEPQSTSASYYAHIVVLCKNSHMLWQDFFAFIFRLMLDRHVASSLNVSNYFCLSSFSVLIYKYSLSYTTFPWGDFIS